jgi:hypothetical protein
MDLYICQQTCPLQPKFEHNNKRYNKPSRQIKTTILPLHVGYLSNDWRDHPMGRLTSNLVTAHSVSKRLSLKSDDFTVNDDNIEENNIRTINKITTYRNIMKCRDHHHSHTYDSHDSIQNHDDDDDSIQNHDYDDDNYDDDDNDDFDHHHHHHCNYGDRIYASALSYGSNDHSDIRAKVMHDSFEFLDYSSILNDVDVAEDIHKRQFDIIVDITGTTASTTTTTSTNFYYHYYYYLLGIFIYYFTTHHHLSHHIGHTCNGRIDIVALKPAPLIINYLGFPGTTGCEGFSYSTVRTSSYSCRSSSCCCCCWWWWWWCW